MDVRLSERGQRLAEQAVIRGHASTPGTAVERALEIMALSDESFDAECASQPWSAEYAAEVQSMVDEGLAELDSGQAIPFDDALREYVKAEGRARRRRRGLAAG
jgi:hypothetical protein